jgi:tetratricopeptide (TPR) repeat protein
LQAVGFLPVLKGNALLTLLLLLAQAAPQPSEELVVYGRRLEALKACEVRQCSTPEDVRLAITHAEALFARGRYSEARETLSAALSRQRRNAPQFPRLVAALYEANATVNLHLGDMDGYRTAIIGQAQSLRENLPEDDPQVLLMKVQLGDFWLKQRQLGEARRQFESAARSYARRGDERLSALCQLRAVGVDIALRNFAGAEKRLATIARSPVAADQAVRLVSAVLDARLAAARGKEVDVEALIATLRTQPGAAPALVRSGKLSVHAKGASDRQDAKFGERQAVQPGRTALQWADIGFMIGADGRVSDAEVLRSSRGTSWAGAYLAEIAGRRYTPVDLPPGHPGSYRVERYTLRSERVVPIGSLVKQAAGPASVVVTDLTGHHAGPAPVD